MFNKNKAKMLLIFFNIICCGDSLKRRRDLSEKSKPYAGLSCAQAQEYSKKRRATEFEQLPFYYDGLSHNQAFSRQLKSEKLETYTYDLDGKLMIALDISAEEAFLYLLCYTEKMSDMVNHCKEMVISNDKLAITIQTDSNPRQIRISINIVRRLLNKFMQGNDQFKEIRAFLYSLQTNSNVKLKQDHIDRVIELITIAEPILEIYNYDFIPTKVREANAWFRKYYKKAGDDQHKKNEIKSAFFIELLELMCMDE